MLSFMNTANDTNWSQVKNERSLGLFRLVVIHVILTVRQQPNYLSFLKILTEIQGESKAG